MTNINRMDAIVTTDWLAAHLREPDLRVVDGTWHMPQLKRDARAEFAKAHIPGAVFFDIDAIADHGTTLPHMLPSAVDFAAAVGALGIGSGDRVVVYDVRGVSARPGCGGRFARSVTTRSRSSTADCVSGRPRAARSSPAPGRRLARSFTAKLRPELVRNVEAMRANVTSRAAQVLDARSRGRFVGTEPEPRAGLRGGHIPGSLNLPYETLYRPDGTLKAPDDLRSAVTSAGVDLARPIVTTCGSGVTASVLALALFQLDPPTSPSTTAPGANGAVAPTPPSRNSDPPREVRAQPAPQLIRASDGQPDRPAASWFQ